MHIKAEAGDRADQNNEPPGILRNCGCEFAWHRFLRGFLSRLALLHICMAVRAGSGPDQAAVSAKDCWNLDRGRNGRADRMTSLGACPLGFLGYLKLTESMISGKFP